MNIHVDTIIRVRHPYIDLVNRKMSDEENYSTDIAIPLLVRFGILLPFYIPSLVCSLFVLYHLIFDQILLKALHNHVIILLLLVNFLIQLTSLSWTIDYYRRGSVLLFTREFCLTWLFMEESLFISMNLLFAWATIERHLLILHDRLFIGKIKRLILHYFPLVFLLVYCICYNTIAVLLPPCSNTFDYSAMVCALSSLLTCSLALLIRVIYQKYRLRQGVRWRNYRKMTIQLLSISALYFVIYIPEMLMEFAYLCGVSEDIGADFMNYMEFFTHYGNILFPFVCVVSLPELTRKVQRIFFCFHQQQVYPFEPVLFTITRRVHDRPKEKSLRMTIKQLE